MPSHDPFGSYVPGLDSPAAYVFPITASPDDLPFVTRAIRVQTGGILTVVTLAGHERSLAFTDGETRPVRVVRVTDLGTCAGVEGMV